MSHEHGGNGTHDAKVTAGASGSACPPTAVPHAFEKLHMHGSAHSDQVDADNPLLNMAREPPARGDGTLPLQKVPFASDGLVTAAHGVLQNNAQPGTPRPPSRTTWGEPPPMTTYGKDPDWRSAQLSFLHAEQQRAESVGAPPPPASVVPAAAGAAPAAAGDADYDAHDDLPLDLSDLTQVPHVDVSLAYQRVPSDALALFAPHSTRQQPHLDVLRARREKHEREDPDRPADGAAEVHKVAKRKSSSQGLLSDAEKKANHIASEQKRRANIRKGYEMLSDALPALQAEAAPVDEEGRPGSFSEIAILNEGTCARARSSPQRWTFWVPVSESIMSCSSERRTCRNR
ncbi:hypothetical protein MSPP1_001059 [Malassezia sp. CBS 17886]|nr:hypothetical protein MSPP1_001059 [Malassezia sp. CBS 17886]